jgi:oligopeptide transport system permease protein
LTSCKKRYLITVKLAVIALLFETVIGIFAGVLAGIRKGKFIDNLVLVSTLVVISIPTFVIGSLARPSSASNSAGSP